MSVDGARARFRRSERRLMRSTVTVSRPGTPSFNSTTGTYTEPTTTVYTGVALIRSNAWEGSDLAVADTEVRARPWRVKLPHGTALRPGDRVTISTSDNPTLVGKVLRVTDFFGDDWAPSDPYFCEEIT